MENNKPPSNASRLRDRAVKELEANTGHHHEISGMSHQETADLIHELQVHQVELKMQNEELRRIQSELEAARDGYAHLYDFSPMGYITLTLEGIIEAANLTVAAMVGVERGHLIGSPFSRFIFRDDQDIFYRHRRLLLETEKPQNCELRLVKKDGTEFNARLECLVVTGPDDDGRRIRGAVIDTTARRLAEQEKAQLQEQLRQSQKMEAIGTLAGGIAHNFNNILAAVLGYAELSLEDADPNTNLHHNLEQVLVAGRRAAVLVQQILTYSRKSVNQMQPLDLALVVGGAVSMIKASLPSTIKITTDIQAANAMITGDTVQVHQVVMNLCINGAQALEEGRGEITIRLKNVHLDQEASRQFSGLKPGRYFKLVVSDTGQGMTPETIERIFEPYFTTGNIATSTGMGLSVVNGIVQDHHGAITVTSRPQGGSTFEVYFPVLEKTARGDKDSLFEDLPRGRERILFVDDEPQLSNLQQKSLERLGYAVTAVTSSLEALDMFKDNPQGFDLVITDMTMPHMTGDRLATEIKSIRPHLPIILCTGYSERVSDDLVHKLDADEVLIKPMERAVLARALRRLLDRYEPGDLP